MGCACEGVGDGIYIWFEEGDVALYDPERNEVTELGTLDCDMPAYLPSAIAVAPDGVIAANLANGSGGGYPLEARHRDALSTGSQKTRWPNRASSLRWRSDFP